MFQHTMATGTTDRDDVMLFYPSLDWIVDNEPPAAFDLNGNGRIEFDDIVWLYKKV